MLFRIPEQFFGFLAVWLTGVYLAIFMLNIFVFNLDRSRYKRFFKIFLIISALLVLPAILIVFRKVPWLEQTMLFEATNPGARLALTTLAVLWTTALVCQIVISLRVVIPVRPPHWIGKRTRQAPYSPRHEDWDALRNEDWEKTPPPPSMEYKRPVKPKRVKDFRNRIVLSEFFQRFDESYDLQIHEIALQFPNLPKAFDGLRVLHISDIHHGEMLSPNYYHHVVEQAVALKADMVVVTGDFPATDNSYKESIEILSPLKPPMGIWAVRGNHDFYTEPELIAHWIKEHGIGLLSNCYTDFEREGQKFRLIGVEHPFLDVTDWDALMGPDEGGEPIFRLALSHVPDNIRNLSRVGADLVLSGHTHGGQWRLPLIGPLVIPSIYGRRYDQGLKQVGKSLLYVSRGMGIHTIPLRFNCPPEIAVFDLRRG